jgi:type IX secretion system PorP/SprF family membrane protein
MRPYKVVAVIAALLISAPTFAQQLPLFSQYMQNDFVLNPAIAGTKEYAPFRSIIRNQWSGLEGQPNTQTLSFHNSIKNRKMGYGLYVFNDRLGPVSQAGLSAAYSYRLEFGNGSKLSFGLAGQVYRYRLFTDQLQFNNLANTDKALMTGNFRAFYPNFSFGTYYYTDKYYAGISVPELLENRISTSTDFFIIKKKRHYFLTGGYKYKIDDTYTVEPSLLVKYVGGAPVEVDINARLHAFDKFSLGVSYRTQDAVVLLLGFKFKEQFHLGYSYDITTSPLKRHSSGSHEIMLGYDLFKAKSASQIN